MDTHTQLSGSALGVAVVPFRNVI